MSKFNFLTDDKLLQNTYLYENKIFTTKGNQSIVWGGKGKDRVPLVKSLFNALVRLDTLGGVLKNLKRIGLCDKKVWSDYLLELCSQLPKLLILK